MKKQRRLKKDEQFQKIFKHGKSFGNKQFILYFLATNNEQFKLGLSVSKKVGNAVVRNKIKRIVKQVFFDLDEKIRQNYDFIVIARKESASLNYFNTKKSLIHILKKVALIND